MQYRQMNGATRDMEPDLPRVRYGPEEAPDEFVALVRDAVVHLYDHAHLERHPLRRLVPPESTARELGRGLRQVLVAAIEGLRASGSDASDDPAWRPYTIFARRYVNGSDEQRIREHLHISLRQYQREHRKGLLAIGSVLWRRWRIVLADATGTSSAGSEEGSGAISDEVDRLGVIPQEVHLPTLVEEVMGPLRVLASERQVCLHSHLAPSPVVVWADPMLT